MKTVFLILVSLAVARATTPKKYTFKTYSVDADFIAKQKKVLSLFENIIQDNVHAEYYEIGSQYDIRTNIENYTNEKAVKNFLNLYRAGFLAKNRVFSINNDRMLIETKAIFHILYYAKDFDTFYKTAAWARVHLNDYQFFHAYYTALINRIDTTGFIKPTTYEAYPQLSLTADVLRKIYMVQAQNGTINAYLSPEKGAIYENGQYIFFSNFSSAIYYDDEDRKLAYFMEDVDLSFYIYAYHLFIPFWLEGDYLGAFKDVRGDIFYTAYRQILGRYYMERLSNGMGEIPRLSWFNPIKKGYNPNMIYKYPFVARNNQYFTHTTDNYEDLQYINAYEEYYIRAVQQGHLRVYNQKADLTTWEAINLVGNYWEGNVDLYEKMKSSNPSRTYDIVTRRLLSAAPKSNDKYTVFPSTLEFFQTFSRDPVYYQYLARTIDFIILYLKNLQPYSYEELHYSGVKIEEVKVGELVTYFDFFDYDATNALYLTDNQLKTESRTFKIRQEGLHHKHFTVNIDVKSEISEPAVFKIFLGPKYDSIGNILSIEENWQNFVQMDTFVYNLTQGQNEIERKCGDFFFFMEKMVYNTDVYNLLDEEKIPKDMQERYYLMPNRFMLPKGTKDGLPLQLFVVAYPYEPLDNKFDLYKVFMTDSKTWLYPIERPAIESSFKQHNMFFKDVKVYHES